VDASGQKVGRLAQKIATILTGKHKPIYHPTADVGDYVVVTNADKVVFTGRKWDQKIYRKHTQHPGGLKV
jgi:large subunit ribosomal protein L13